MLLFFYSKVHNELIFFKVMCFSQSYSLVFVLLYTKKEKEKNLFDYWVILSIFISFVLMGIIVQEPIRNVLMILSLERKCIFSTLEINGKEIFLERDIGITYKQKEASRQK